MERRHTEHITYAAAAGQHLQGNLKLLLWHTFRFASMLRNDVARCDAQPLRKTLQIGERVHRQSLSDRGETSQAPPPQQQQLAPCPCRSDSIIKPVLAHLRILCCLP